MTTSGTFIVFEGLDRSGKTTQCAKIAEYLRAYHDNVVELKFPDRTTTIGQMINSYLTNPTVKLSDQTIHLLFSANRWEIRDKLQGLLDSGAIVIADRYIYSGVAFSAAKGLDFDWCMAPEKGLPIPDRVVFLDVNEEIAMQRGGYGLERYETREMQQNVRTQFLKLKEANWSWVNAGESIDDVFEKIKLAVEPLIRKNLD